MSQQTQDQQEGIAALRKELFATLRGVKDKSIDLDTAKQIASLGSVIVDSARVEVDFLKATGHTSGTGFLDADQNTPKPALPPGITGQTTHRLK